KYPLSIAEIFYINTSRCEFNATILQDRRAEIDSSEEPFWSRYDLRWENNIRFSKIIPHHNPASGWMRAAWLPKDHEKEANLVGFNHFDGQKYYHPKNDMTFAAGRDPIDHGIVIQGKSNDNDEEFLSARRAKQVLLLQRKYD